MNTNSSNQISSASILQDAFSKIGLVMCVVLLSINFTQLFPYVLLMSSSLLAGYFLSKMRDRSKDKVIVNEKVNFFESMIHESNDSILLYDIECRKYQYVNRTFESNFKMNLKQLNAAAHPKFLNITNGDLGSMISKLEKGTQSIFKFEVKMVRKDGSEGSFDATLERIIIDSKNFAELTLHEITEAKTQVAEMSQDIDQYGEIIQQYKDNNRVLEEKAAKLALHDFQNPIQTIIRDIQMLETESWFKLDMDEKNSVHSIKGQVNNLSRMLKDVASFSALGTNTTSMETMPMTALVQNVIDQLEFKIKESGTLIEVAQLPAMQVDGLQIKELFKSLIENAIDNRGDKTPEILISSIKEDQQWRISVTDNCGVNSNDSGSFLRSNNKEDKESFEINLASCQKIIDNHLGTIGVESEAEDRSTVFFTIPMSTSGELVNA